MPQEIGTPLQAPDLLLSPEQAEGPELSTTMQQAIALMMGYWQNQRIVLKATPTGVLFGCSPQVQDIVHYTASGDDDNQAGADLPCSEVICMGHPDNKNVVWVRPHVTATVNNAWPLEDGDAISFTIVNLSMLHMLFEKDTEKLIVLYTM